MTGPVTATHVDLTDEQRAAVHWGEGPLMVLAGAGTGKTTVIVERIAWLLGRAAAAPPIRPENILVLTYNVRATAELTVRLQQRLGMDVAGRVWVHNFHSFGQRILQDNAAEAGLPDRVEVLDSIGQRLLLNELRGDLDLLYHGFADLPGQLGRLAALVNRARDELVTPAEYRRYVDERLAAFEAIHGAGAHDRTIAELRDRGDLAPVRQVRRALVRGGDAEAERAADREARRAASGTGRALAWQQLTRTQHAVAEGIRPTFLRDAAALEVLRLQEEARVYGAYLAALRARGALDFGEQILRAIALLQQRANVLRRYQAQFRHVMVDEFQDANIAQVLLLELLGRSPERPDNVVVVGDDDQAIYRFRGASYAAFEQFRERFERAPSWDPERDTPPITRLSLVRNRRSTPEILSAAGRLIAHNAGRLKSGPLLPARPHGDPVELIVAADEQDEAAAVCDAIRAAFDALPERIELPDGTSRPRRWGDVAVLYRRHRHRDAIGEALRQAGIPHMIVGDAGLFNRPDVRDVECALRVLARTDDSVSFVRLLAAPPWRLDATEILRLTRAAAFGTDESPWGVPVYHVALEAIRTGVVITPAPPTPVSAEPAMPVQLELLPAIESGETPAAAAPRPRRGRAGREPISPATRVRLQRLMDCISDLAERGGREGPFTLLDEYLVRAGIVRDLVATGTADAQRGVLAIAGLMRFVGGWQRDHTAATLTDFVAYLDLYQEAGGDLDAETGAATMDGVQLMTVHQAKGLEWEVVVVPRLVEGQFPVERAEELLIPVELLRQVPPGDFQEAEERRLCYVAMTRARRRLVLSAISGPAGAARPSRFACEVAPGGLEPDGVQWRGTAEAGPAPHADGCRTEAGPDEAVVVVRTAAAEQAVHRGGVAPGGQQPSAQAAGAEVRMPRLMPAPTVFERRFSLRRRAVELVGALELVDPSDTAGRSAILRELAEVGLDAARAAGEDRARGVDPLTLRALAMDEPAGAALLRLVPPPDRFSYSAFGVYRECPLRYAFQYVYRIQVPDEDRKGYFTFGSIVHAAFESFGRAWLDAEASGAPHPDESDLHRFFDAAWQPLAFPDRLTAESYGARSPAILRNFFARQLSRLAESVAFERRFEMPLDPGDGGPAAVMTGAIDRIDRLPGGRFELIDYKTGHARSQADVDADEQLTIYALAMRDGAVSDPATGRPLPAPDLLTLYFTESDQWLSTTRTDGQLEEQHERLAAVARQIRAGRFTGTPSYEACRRCDYARLCPVRWGG